MPGKSSQPSVIPDAYLALAAWLGAYPAPARPARPGQDRWRRAVLERDGYRCVACGETRDLHAHHLRSWVAQPAQRLDPANGVTLCAFCHQEAHHSRDPPPFA